ncbi:Uncharacterized protein APZ42_001989 [Daphnia magna]|uniref:Uncharacterized protein n=1 Tax=Daphnia magna TaxID=35525 RepID=A0A164IL84_9CRUS|nr:Uncharacterized protein APZ42_001989 [Daphnia magna]
MYLLASRSYLSWIDFILVSACISAMGVEFIHPRIDLIILFCVVSNFRIFVFEIDKRNTVP